MAFVYDNANKILRQVAGETDYGAEPFLNSDLKTIKSEFQTSIAVYCIGKKRILILSPQVKMEISGSYTLNGENCQLNFDANQPLVVLGNGYLQFGETTTNYDDKGNEIVRDSGGILFTNKRAQAIWWGGNKDFGQGSFTGGLCSLVIAGAGKFRWIGGTAICPGSMSFAEESSVLITNGNWFVQEILPPAIDPCTGNVVKNSVGINNGVPSSDWLKVQSDGYYGWQRTNDIRMENFVFRNGGQFGLIGSPSSNNSLDPTLPNLISLNTIQTKNAFLSSQQSPTQIFTLFNTSISLTGNLKDIGLQSQKGFAKISNISIKNERNCSNLSIICDRNNRDPRNYGLVRIFRSTNFNILDALTGDGISGGLYYIKDTDNGIRKNLNGYNYLSNQIYSGSIVSGKLIDDVDILLAVSNSTFTSRGRLGNNSVNPAGINIDRHLTRLNSTQIQYIEQNSSYPTLADQFIFEIDGVKQSVNSTNGQTVFNVGSNVDSVIKCQLLKNQNVPFIWDLRSTSGIVGEDTFSGVYWHPEYNPFIFTVNLNNQQTGTYEIGASILPDSDYSDTSTGKTTLSNLDQLYDYIKQKKSSSDAEIVYPTQQILAVEKTGDYLNIGSRSLQVLTDTLTVPYSLDDNSIFVRTSDEFGIGSKFKGIQSTSNIDCDNINLLNMSIKTSGLIENLPQNITADYLEGEYINNLTGSLTLTFNKTTDVSKLVMKFPNSTGIITIVNKNSSDFDLVPVTNGTLVFDPNSSLKFEIPSTHPTGYYYLQNLTNSSLIKEGKHIKGTSTLVHKIDNDKENPTEFRLLFKGQNDLNNADLSKRIIYQTSFVTDKNNYDGNIILTPQINTHSDLLTKDAEKITDVGTIAASITMDEGDAFGKLNITGVPLSSNPSNSYQTQRIILKALDTEYGGSSGKSIYLRLLANSNSTEDLIVPASNSATQIDSDSFTMSSGNNNQQFISAVDFIGTGTRINTFTFDGKFIPQVLIYPNPLGLTSAQLQSAITSNETIKGIASRKIEDYFSISFTAGKFPNTSQVVISGYRDSSLYAPIGSLNYSQPEIILGHERSIIGCYLDFSVSNQHKIEMIFSKHPNEVLNNLPDSIFIFYKGYKHEVHRLTSITDMVQYSGSTTYEGVDHFPTHFTDGQELNIKFAHLTDSIKNFENFPSENYTFFTSKDRENKFKTSLSDIDAKIKEDGGKTRTVVKVESST